LSSTLPSYAAAYQQALDLCRRGDLNRAEAHCREILRAHPGPDVLLLLGVIELQGGRAAQAAASFTRSLRADPAQFMARALLGDALLDLSRPQEALDSYERALQLSPDLVPAHFGRANALLDLRRPLDALAGYDMVLRLQPLHPEAYFNRGNVLFGLGSYGEAVASYDKAIERKPGYASAYNNRGGALLSLRRPAHALKNFDAALAIDAAFAGAMHNRGRALRELQRPEEALLAFEGALRLRRGYVEAHCGRGDALLDLGRPEEALASHEAAAACEPHSSTAHHGRGNSLRILRRFSEAIAAYDEALRLDAGNAAAHCDRANALLDAGQHDAALAGFETALRLKPDFPQALRSRGDALFCLRQPEAAAACYGQLLQSYPESEYTPGALLHAQQCCADWSVNVVAAAREQIQGAVLAGARADSPFSFLSVADSPAAQLRCARTFVAHRCPPMPPLWNGERYRHERIRLAYVSADFRAHAVSYLLAGVFERHDRRRFETTALSLRPEESSAMGRRVRGAFDRFIDIGGRSDREAAQLLHALEIDIAVDLTGFTDGFRPQIFSRRPAPIQVNYLGFPATMGADYMDYILADDFVIPADQQRHYAECVVRLPDCFQANDDTRLIAPGITRSEAGLPEGAFVFCCLNNTYKLNPTMFEIWMRLLDRVPDSVLWLLGAGAAAGRNLGREAANRGIDPARLVFAPRKPYPDYLGRLPLADLFLDTLPFNAGATAGDALWAGLPVLTCAGESFAARMAGSILWAAGLSELITHTLADYELQALRLAQQPQILNDLRRRLGEARRRAPVFDTERCVRSLESAYVQMWQRHEQGGRPCTLAVPRGP
jgi:protein O-GlcNAc transferase